MNIRFRQILEQSGLSMYRLAKNTGVSYSVINDLAQGKKDINHCEAHVVSRLAAGLHVHMESLINDYPVLDRTEGTYRGIRYRWHADDTMSLTIRDGESCVMIDTGYHLNIPGRLILYEALTELLIDDYLEKKEFDLFSGEWARQKSEKGDSKNE